MTLAMKVERAALRVRVCFMLAVLVMKLLEMKRSCALSLPRMHYELCITSSQALVRTWLISYHLVGKKTLHGASSTLSIRFVISTTPTPFLC